MFLMQPESQVHIVQIEMQTPGTVEAPAELTKEKTVEILKEVNNESIDIVDK